MKIWNLSVKRGVDGSKHLDIQMHGVIDAGWGDSVDTSDVISELNQHLDAKTVQVRINSVGGAAFGGVAMYNALQAHPGEVTCCVEGLAASAASLVAMAGKTVMGKGAMMMIHSPSTVAMGNSTELRKTADVLDQVQDALAEIYKSKTGKSIDEINDMLDEETWMTADQAVASGFADEVMPDAKIGQGPGEQDPAKADPDGDDDVENRAPQLLAQGVRWGGVVFPLNTLPQQIVAMAKVPPPVQTPAVATPPVLAIVPQSNSPRNKYRDLALAMERIAEATGNPIGDLSQHPKLTRELLDSLPPLDRAEVAARAPGMLGDARQEGVAAERARLQAIDDLAITGAADLVAAAKYGEKPSDAPTLAMAIVKAGKMAGAELLALRRQESEPLVAIATGAPDQTAAASEARLIAAMVAGGNARRGGVQ